MGARRLSPRAQRHAGGLSWTGTESNEIHRNICRAIALGMDKLVLVVPEVYEHANGKALSGVRTRDMAERLRGKIKLEIKVIAY